jgi:signal transduction histidine kinase
MSMQEDAIERLRAARLVAAADAERRAFERKLHDGVQQELVALVVNLQLARELCATDPNAAGVLLDQVGRDTRAALDGLRRLATEIYPPLLDAGGLVVALRSAAAEAGIVARVDADVIFGSDPEAHPEVVTTVYFCCLEALQNAAQHGGGGAKTTVSVRREAAAVVFEVADDGDGFAQSQPTEGGLRRIVDRVGALGGRLEIESEPGHGTRVRGRLPLTS